MASIFAIALFVFVILPILAIIYMELPHFRLNNKMKNIVVPTGGIPLVGHALTLLKGDVWGLIAIWHKSYGDILRFRVFGQTFVSVANPDLLKEILRTKVEEYEKDIAGTYHQFMCLLGTGLVTSHGALWRAQRSLMSSVFNVEILNEVADMSVASVDRFTRKLSNIKSGQEFDVAEDFRHLTLEVIGGAILSLSPDECDRVFPGLYLPIMEEANKRIWAPWREYIPSALSPAIKHFYQCASELNTYVRECVTKRMDAMLASREKGEEPEKQDILGKILNGTDVSTWKENKTIQQLADEIKTFVFAGHETSALMLTWSLYELSKREDLQKKIIEEYDELFGKDFKMGDAAPNFKDIKKGLHFTENVLKEALRKWSVVPVLTRLAASDQQLGDYFIPKGANVMVPVIYMHQREDFWPNPKDFDPDRFDKKLTDRTAYMPFLQGPRDCVGQYFALLEGKIVLSTLIKRFIFKTSSKTTVQTHPFQVPVSPKDGMWMTVEPRK